MKIILDNGIEILIPKEIAYKLLATGIMSLNEIEAGSLEVALKKVKVPKLAKSEPLEIKQSESGRRSFTDAERDNIIEMRKRGFSAREIAKKMQCKPAKIDQYLFLLRKKGLFDSAESTTESNLEGI